MRPVVCVAFRGVGPAWGSGIGEGVCLGPHPGAGSAPRPLVVLRIPVGARSSPRSPANVRVRRHTGYTPVVFPEPGCVAKGLDALGLGTTVGTCVTARAPVPPRVLIVPPHTCS